MKLVINKTKRETIAIYMLGAFVLFLIISIGYYINLPVSKIVSAEKFLSTAKLFPLNKIIIPVPGFVFKGI